MSEPNHISVNVVGTPHPNCGIVPLVLYNCPKFCHDYDFFGCLSDNAYYCSFKIDEEYTVYELVINNVISNNGRRLSYLSIAFSIPRGYELETTNPYRVLIDLWNEFAKNYLFLKDVRTKTYEFHSVHIDSHVLDKIAQSYLLKPSDNLYRTMKKDGGRALIVQTKEKIEELLKDVQYPQFSKFRKVYIAERVVGDSSHFTILDKIPIPRIRKFSLIVDGKNAISGSDDSIVSVKSNENPNFFENRQEIISVSDLLEGCKIIPGVHLDIKHGIIRICTKGWAIPKRKRIQIRINPPSEENYFREHKKILMLHTHKGKPIPLYDDLSFRLEGEEIGELDERGRGLNIQMHPISIYLISSVHYSDISDCIDIFVKKKPVSIENADFKKIDVYFRVNESVFKDSRGKYHVKMCCRGDDGIIQTRNVTFVHNKEPNGLGGSAVFYIPTEYEKDFVHFSFYNWNHWYISPRSYRLSEGHIIVDDFEKDRMIKRKCFIVAFLLLILFLGIFLGYGINKIECYLFPDEEIKKSLTVPDCIDGNAIDKTTIISDESIVDCENSSDKPKAISPSTPLASHFDCIVCGLRFHSKRQLEHHMITHRER